MTQSERDKRIEEIRERCENVDNAESWRIRGMSECGCCSDIETDAGALVCSADNRGTDHFIAHSRADIPFLLAEIDRLKLAYELK